MKTAIRRLTTRRLGALIGVAALAAALPATAMAGHRDEWRGESRYDDGDRHGRHRGWHQRHDGGRSGHRGHGRHATWHRPRPARGVFPTRAAPAYACGRCRLHFGSYDRLYGHVHHHHRVPVWSVPGLISQVSFGFVFGY